MKKGKAGDEFSNLHPSNLIVFGTYSPEEEENKNEQDDTFVLENKDTFSMLHPSNDIIFGASNHPENEIIKVEKTSPNPAGPINLIQGKNPITFLLQSLMKFSFLLDKPQEDQESTQLICKMM